MVSDDNALRNIIWNNINGGVDSATDFTDKWCVNKLTTYIEIRGIESWKLLLYHIVTVMPKNKHRGSRAAPALGAHLRFSRH